MASARSKDDGIISPPKQIPKHTTKPAIREINK